MRKKSEKASRLTVENFINFYGSKFRGLLGGIHSPCTEEEARAFYERHHARIMAAIDARGYGREVIDKWLNEKK